MPRFEKQKGFTLIEVLIYIALLGFIMTIGVASAYYLINSTAQEQGQVNTTAEAEFLMRKIDWAMTGANYVDASTKTIKKYDGQTIVFDLDVNRVKITVDGATEYLTSSRVKVTSFVFTEILTVPKGITVSLIIDGKNFEITKYIRK